MGIGGWEILVILVVVLLVFGPKRIPEVSRGLGKGMRELRRVGTEFQRELNLSDVEAREERDANQTRDAVPERDANQAQAQAHGAAEIPPTPREPL